MMPRRVSIPLFEIEREPRVVFGNISSRRFDMIDRGRCPVCGESVQDLREHLAASDDPEHIVHEVMGT